MEACQGSGAEPVSGVGNELHGKDRTKSDLASGFSQSTGRHIHDLHEARAFSPTQQKLEGLGIAACGFGGPLSCEATPG